MKSVLDGIIIQNFLSHKHTELKFHKGVNVFIGVTDSGKSAIIKAIDWCVNNNPSGDDYRSDWGGDTIVGISLSEGIVVSREKAGSNNLYYVYNNKHHDPESSPQLYKSFGQGVPEEVQKIFNMSKVNFQFQTERHFLISNTSGEVARFINKVAKLEEIDVGLKNAERFKHSTNTDIKNLIQTEEEIIDELKEYEDIDDLEKQADKLSVICKKADILDLQVIELGDIINECEELDEISKRMPKDLDKIFDKFLRLQKIQKEIEILDSDIKDLDAQTFVYNDCVEKIVEYDETLKFENKYIKLDKLYDTIQDINEFIDELESLISDYESVDSDIVELQNTLGNLTQEYDSIMSDRCPLCGQTIPKK